MASSMTLAHFLKLAFWPQYHGRSHGASEARSRKILLSLNLVLAIPLVLATPGVLLCVALNDAWR